MTPTLFLKLWNEIKKDKGRDVPRTLTFLLCVWLVYESQQQTKRIDLINQQLAVVNHVLKIDNIKTVSR